MPQDFNSQSQNNSVRGNFATANAARPTRLPRMSLLRDTQIRALNSAGYHRVDSRLYLQVTVNRTGAVRKSWIFRYRLAGKSSELGLGPYPVVSLATALSRRDTLLLAIDSGEDPREALGRKARAMPAKRFPRILS